MTRARFAFAPAFALVVALASCSRGKDAKDPPSVPAAPILGSLLTGDTAKGDYRTDAPGVRRQLTLEDLPPPNDTPSVDNGPHIVKRPDGAELHVPEGFRVDLFAKDLENPRMIRTAPNGDLFVAESNEDRVRVLRDADGDGKPEVVQIFAEGLNKPFGIGFYPPGPSPQWVYIANTDSVVRFPYVSGDVKARGAAQKVVSDISGGGFLRGGGHWTRDLVFALDGTKMFISVGSRSNVGDSSEEDRRARIFEYSPDGKSERVYATGIRNPVGLAIHPTSGELWTSVNERDELGDHLVPDYITRVRDGAFYGWPWFYLGAHQDPRHAGKHPELASKVVVPDVLLQSHSASLGMTFYRGTAFPEAYRGSAFAAEHGSWNRARRTGYKVIAVPLNGTAPTGEYDDFLTGFVTQDGDVWGRPVAVTEGNDGALYVSDDAGDCVWKIAATAR